MARFFVERNNDITRGAKSNLVTMTTFYLIMWLLGNEISPIVNKENETKIVGFPKQQGLFWLKMEPGYTLINMKKIGAHRWIPSDFLDQKPVCGVSADFGNQQR